LLSSTNSRGNTFLSFSLISARPANESPAARVLAPQRQNERQTERQNERQASEQRGRGEREDKAAR